MILFGARSPLVVDFEETLARAGVSVGAIVSVSGVPRVIDRSRLIELADFVVEPGAEFLAPAYAPMRGPN